MRVGNVVAQTARPMLEQRRAHYNRVVHFMSAEGRTWRDWSRVERRTYATKALLDVTAKVRDTVRQHAPTADWRPPPEKVRGLVDEMLDGLDDFVLSGQYEDWWNMRRCAHALHEEVRALALAARRRGA